MLFSLRVENGGASLDFRKIATGHPAILNASSYHSDSPHRLAHSQLRVLLVGEPQEHATTANRDATGTRGVDSPRTFGFDGLGRRFQEVVDRANPKSNNDFQPFTMGTKCHILRIRPVWLFRRLPRFDAKAHVLKVRKRCLYLTIKP